MNLRKILEIVIALAVSILLGIVSLFFFLIFKGVSKTEIFNGFFQELIITIAISLFIGAGCLLLIFMAITSYFPGKIERIGKTFLQFATIPISVGSMWGLAFAITYNANLYLEYRLANPWHQLILTIVISILPLWTTKLAVEQASEASLKNWNKGLVISILMIIIISSTFNWGRTDYHDKDGNITVWTTDSNERFWHKKPIFDHDLDTGEIIRIATKKEVKKYREKRKNRSLFGSKNDQETEEGEDDSTPPVSRNWIQLEVDSRTRPLIKAYPGDVFYYRSPGSFTVLNADGKGKKYPKCSSDREVLSFPFLNIDSQGEFFSIVGTSPFTLEYKVRKG